MSSPRDPHGFSLIEAILASALIAGAIVTLAQLVTAGAAQSSSARQQMTTIVLAQSKLEELRATPFAFAADGSRITSGALAESPDASLTQDAGGWVEQLDRFGDAATDGAPFLYRRRWAVQPLQPFDVDTLVLRVCVFAAGRDGPNAVAEACVSGIRTRKP